MRLSNRWLSVIAPLALLSLAACHSHSAQNGQNAQDASAPAASVDRGADQKQAASSNPAPKLVLVYRFHIPSDLLMERFSTGVSSRGRDTTWERQIALANEVQDGVARDLVDRISALGIPAKRSSSSLNPTPVCLILQGQFVSRDQLDPSHRNVIGFEPSQSVVVVHVTLSQLVANKSSVVMAFTTRAHSAPMPDALVNVGAGLGGAGNHNGNSAPTAIEHYGPQVEDLASQSAGQISAQLAQYFSQQGWISPATLRSQATSNR